MSLIEAYVQIRGLYPFNIPPFYPVGYLKIKLKMHSKFNNTLHQVPLYVRML